MNNHKCNEGGELGENFFWNEGNVVRHIKYPDYLKELQQAQNRIVTDKN